MNATSMELVSDDLPAPTWRETIERFVIAAMAEVAWATGTGQLPNPAGPASGVIQDMAARRQKKALDFVETVEWEVGPDRLQQIQDDPEREALLWTAIQAAMATGLEKKRIYLARVAAGALNSDEPVDEAQVMVAILEQLDGPHIRALARIVVADDQNQADPGNGDEILQAALEKEPVPVLAALARSGVVYQGSVERGNGLATIPRSRTLSITGVNDFGRKLLDDLTSMEISG